MKNDPSIGWALQLSNGNMGIVFRGDYATCKLD